MMLLILLIDNAVDIVVSLTGQSLIIPVTAYYCSLCYVVTIVVLVFGTFNLTMPTGILERSVDSLVGAVVVVVVVVVVVFFLLFMVVLLLIYFSSFLQFFPPFLGRIRDHG